MHWNRSNCGYPSFTDHQWELLVGTLLGDGDIHGRGDTNSHFRVRMTSRSFLEYLDDEFGVLSKGVYLARDAERQYKSAAKNRSSGRQGFVTVNRENYNDLFGFRSCSHPELDELRGWYETGEKRFPDDLTLTPTIAKTWYVCDGWLADEDDSRPRIMIKTSNEADRADYLTNLFADAGFDAGFSRYSVQIPTAETVRLFEWMGEPLPGFEYKWPTHWD